jgi:hypothetical protein
MAEQKKCRECDVVFESKSEKQKFHSIACKNRYNYKITNFKMDWEIQQFKKRKKTIKILSALKRRNRKKLTKADLTLLQVDLTAAYLPIKHDNNELAYRFGSYYVVVKEEKTCTILTPSEYEQYASKTA